MEAYLDGHPLVLDGCFNGQGSVFSVILEENAVHGFALTSKVDKCPIIGNDVFVNPVAFNSDAESFSLWRHIKGHEVTFDELHELLNDGCTQKEVVLNDENGSLSKAALRFSPDRKRIVPDFYPESDKQASVTNILTNKLYMNKKETIKLTARYTDISAKERAEDCGSLSLSCVCIP